MGIAPTEQRGPASDRGVASPAGDRWVGVGHAGDSDPADAGARACADALGGRAAKLLIVFASDSYDLQALLRGVRSQGADAALVGCTTAGEISRAGAGDEGVVVTALGGDGFEVRTAVGHGAPGRLREAGAAAAAAMTEPDPGDRSRVLMLLSDGVAGDQQEAMRGVHDVVGAGMPLVGGCAGDGMKMERTFQLHGDEVIAGGVVSAAIASTGPLLLGEDRVAEEVAAITACAGEAPFAGLYTYGEIARVRGVNAVHSQTFVAMAIG